jgi:transposase, IS5 family
VLRSTGELAELAETAARDAQRLLVNAQRAVRRAQARAAELRARGEHDAAAGRRRGRLMRAVNDLAELLAATRRIVAQTRQRVAGHTPDGATRRISLHDDDARPIGWGGWGGRSSSGTRPRSSTTMTGSCSITVSSRAIRPTRRNWRPR